MRPAAIVCKSLERPAPGRARPGRCDVRDEHQRAMVRSHGSHVWWRHSRRVPPGIGGIFGPGKEKGEEYSSNLTVISLLYIIYEDQGVLWYCGSDLLRIYIHKSVCLEKQVSPLIGIVFLCLLVVVLSISSVRPWDSFLLRKYLLFQHDSLDHQDMRGLHEIQIYCN